MRRALPGHTIKLTAAANGYEAAITFNPRAASRRHGRSGKIHDFNVVRRITSGDPK